MTEEIYYAVTLVARIHPGDREAIDETLQKVLCPIGHFDEPGDPINRNETDCRMDWFASTGTKDLESAMRWCVPDVPDDASELDE